MKTDNFKKYKFLNIFLLAISIPILFGIFYGIWEEIKAYNLEKDISSRSEELVVSSKKSENYLEITIDDVFKKPEDYFIVDVREKEEFEQGRLKGSQNFRLGDILGDDNFQKIILEAAENRKVLFFCHNGERSKVTANSFSDKTDKIFYVVDHAFDELRSSDELAKKSWEGTLKRVLPKGFWEDLKNRGYKIDDISDINTELIVDVTTRGLKLEDKLGAKNIMFAPMVRMPSGNLEKLISDIGERDFSVLCDSKLSCFYAKVLAYRSEKQGASFKGYYLWD